MTEKCIRAQALELAVRAAESEDLKTTVRRADAYFEFMEGTSAILADRPKLAGLRGPLHVKIDGPAGAGKTRLKRHLESTLPQQWLGVITLDDGQHADTVSAEEDQHADTPAASWSPGDVLEVVDVCRRALGAPGIGDLVRVVGPGSSPFDDSTLVEFLKDEKLHRDGWNNSRFKLHRRAGEFRPGDVVECVTRCAGATVGKRYVLSDHPAGHDHYPAYWRTDHGGWTGIGGTATAVTPHFRLSLDQTPPAAVDQPVPLAMTPTACDDHGQRFEPGDIVRFISTEDHGPKTRNNQVVELNGFYSVRSSARNNLIRLNDVRAWSDNDHQHELSSSWYARDFRLIARAADGWRIWNGGECPVPGAVIEWRLRRDPADVKGPALADDRSWDHDLGPSSDIIAYRVVEQAKAEPAASKFKVGDRVRHWPKEWFAPGWERGVIAEVKGNQLVIDWTWVGGGGRYEYSASSIRHDPDAAEPRPLQPGDRVKFHGDAHEVVGAPRAHVGPRGEEHMEIAIWSAADGYQVVTAAQVERLP